MKGDFSRRAFSRGRYYRVVLMQQGRVALDADRDEQNDIIARTGHVAMPLPAGTPTVGFTIGLSPSGGDLTISKGRIDVDGWLVENESPDATLLHQPGRPYPAGAALADLQIGPHGVYVVYLDVWERLITATDDPSVRETALGGPDTSGRTKLFWQVKLGSAQQFDKVPRTCGGIEHRYAKLAVVAFDGNTFQLLPGAPKR